METRYAARGRSAKKLNIIFCTLAMVSIANHLIKFNLVLFKLLRQKKLIEAKPWFGCVSGVAGRLVKSEREATWLEADKLTEVQVLIHFCQGRIINRTKR